MHVSYQFHHQLEAVPVLDTLQVVVQEMQTVELLMVTAAVMLAVVFHITMTAALMLPVQEVLYITTISNIIIIMVLASEFHCLHVIDVSGLFISLTDPRTCADIGIYSCCTNTASGSCEVRTGQHYCTCDISCHQRGDCCSDACISISYNNNNNNNNIY